ncbi:serine/threonine protein kinase [Roseofilum reptotaenium CS-1145]|uniref:Serine/threonine protein kinase n=1 Tax=Roseofilum reptotaenium AO1-A TaxID=1925591 RepID=A0A1L9QWH6_9CYAN|nr:serine/threonine protein kinase [Roseofilum reptotaenium]MDB9518579.1 serine/threonine protein kinase [Roseofilum reptotaenium CS-1145]OJJ27024.1 serine/threonine protein kinase [Roseofilum reptotaenium AO1-A]
MEQSFRYATYGLTLEANQPLPGLTPASANTPVDVWVDLNGMLRSPLTDDLPSGIDWIEKADGTYLQIWFRGDGRYGHVNFEIDSDATHIKATWPQSRIEDVTTLLVGQVLACALRLRGMLCLHACVVETDGRAIAIVGETGAGKSTTAAALANRGYSILADDIAVLQECEEHFLVQPGYPRLRLWPQSVNALYGSEADLTKIFRSSEKRFLDLSDNSKSDTAWQFQSEPLPLVAIYILGERKLGLEAPKIEPIPPAIAVMKLMQQRSVSHFKLDADKQGREFAGFGRVARQVPVRAISRKDSLEALPQLCDAILADLAGTTISASYK